MRLLLVLAFACAPPDPDTSGAGVRAGDSADDSAAGDSTPPTESGDSAGDTGPTVDDAIEAIVTQVGTGGVVRVSWETPEAATGEVRFGEGGALDHVYTAVDGPDGLTHEALVVGLAGGITWTLQAVSQRGHHTWSSAPTDVTTPTPPADLVGIAVDAGSDPTLDGLVLTSSSDIAGAVMLLDRQGRYVWWRQTDVGMLDLQTALSADGTSIEWLQDDDSEVGASTFHREALDGSTAQSFAVPHAHHSFVALPEGGWAFIETDTRSWHGRDVKGDRIVEVDADGNEVREVWSAWDDFEPDEDYDDPGGEWTHFNGLDYVPERDAYLVSIYLFDAAVLIDRTTGALEWELGGDTGDFTFTPEDAGFARIHQARLLPDGDVLLFDNGSPDADAGSEVVEYALDTDAGTATRVFDYDADHAIYGNVRGNADRLDNGDTFVSWGSAGWLSELGADGALRWQAEMTNGNSPGFSHVLLGLGGALR